MRGSKSTADRNQEVVEIRPLMEAKARMEELQPTRNLFQFLNNFRSKQALFVFNRLEETENVWKSIGTSLIHAGGRAGDSV